MAWGISLNGGRMVFSVSSVFILIVNIIKQIYESVIIDRNTELERVIRLLYLSTFKWG